MKALQGRLRRLESRFVEPDYVQRPREHLRIATRTLGGERHETSVPCRRMLCAGGTLMEAVYVDACSGPDLDGWVASFPVVALTSSGSVQ